MAGPVEKRACERAADNERLSSGSHIRVRYPEAARWTARVGANVPIFRGLDPALLFEPPSLGGDQCLQRRA